jgi:hypothetical protein
MNVRALLLVLMLVRSPSVAASNPQDPGTQGTKPDPPPNSTPSLTWHGERIYFSELSAIKAISGPGSDSRWSRTTSTGWDCGSSSSVATVAQL